MGLPSTAYPAIGAIIAAIIAGGISFVTAVLSKDQKTSEFRQAWIDAFRNDIAEYASLFLNISDGVRIIVQRGDSKSQIREYIESKSELFVRMALTETRIKLRANPVEHEELLNVISSIKKYPRSDKSFDPVAAEALIESMTKETQNILKREWKRVKRGEPVFVFTKFMSLIIILVAVLFAISFYGGYLHFQIRP